MRRLFWSAILVAAGTAMSAAALADCADPAEPASIPDASKASEQQMVAAQQEVKHYLGAMEDRLKCLESSGSKEAFNLAVQRMQTVAARFNNTVRVFRSKKT